MIHIRKATEADLAAAMDNLSQQTADEIAEMDLPADEFFAGLHQRVAAGRAHASFDDDKLLTVFGFNEYPDYWSMWTVATADYFSMGARGVLATRRFFRALGFTKPVISATTSPHPDIARWLGALGFEKLEDGIYLLRR